MKFKKKLKLRLGFAVGYIVLGAVLIVMSFVLPDGDQFLSSFGLILAVMGVARLLQYCRITKSDETIRKQEIAETDERNIAIANHAKSAAFRIFLMLCCVAVLVLEALGKNEPAAVLSMAVFGQVLIYLICYFVIGRRS